MSDIKELTEKIKKFRDERDWKQFHNPKDMSLSLVLEATEVLQHFQWKNEKELEEYIESSNEEIGKELADVLYWVLLISYDLKIDIVKIFNKKMAENNKKYPVGKSKGKHTKYTKL